MVKYNQEPGTPGHVWGYDFMWTNMHPKVEDVQTLLYTYDDLAVDALNRIDSISPPGPKDGRRCPMSQRDLYALLKEHASSDEVLGKLWKQVTDIPDWVDWEQIERGQKVVYQYHGQMLLGLMFNSLLGGMAAWRVCETLARTGGFGVQVTRRRLLETLQHFLEVMEDVDSLKPGGKGFVSSVRVRLLHATVRRRIMDLAKQRPDYYNTKEWGVPINDLHQIGTIDAYSTALVYISLPRQGIYLTEQQATDYLALWRWVGYIMGTPVDWMASPAQAKVMMESVVMSEMEPSRCSQIIANNILTAETSSPPMYASRPMLAAWAYRLNGDELAAGLAIDKPNAFYRALAWLQGLLLIFISTAYPWMPTALQKRNNRKFMEYGYEMVTSQKLGGLGHSAKFEFQYTPGFGKTTEMGAFSSGSWQRVVLAGVGIVLSALAIAFVSDMFYPWRELVVQRMAMVIPAEQLLGKLL
ncbi:hypothetical protein ACO1O0_006464 [Amphichorda felina]